LASYLCSVKKGGPNGNPCLYFKSGFNKSTTYIGTCQPSKSPDDAFVSLVSYLQKNHFKKSGGAFLNDVWEMKRDCIVELLKITKSHFVREGFMKRPQERQPKGGDKVKDDCEQTEK
jgi:hypothetical protein